MKKKLFDGVATALVTPFSDDGMPDLDGLKLLIDRQIENGISALVIAGTTGEGSTLSFEEFSLLIAKSNEYIRGRVPLIAGTGSNNTATALKLSLEAKKRGADGLLMVTPYYNKTTQDGLIQHYYYIADRVQLPFILYNVPSRTGLKIQPETCRKLSEHPNIVAIKEASGDISNTMDILHSSPNLTLYSGNDDQMLPILAIGGDGLISVVSNVAPRETVNIYSLFKNGDIQKAITEHYRLLPLIRALFAQVNPIPVKRAMQLLNLPSGEPRLPLIPCDSKTEIILQNAIKNAGL